MQKFCSALIFVGLLVVAISSDLPVVRAQEASNDRVAHVGVLAYRGVSPTKQLWKPLQDYLSASIKGWRFEFIPVTLASTANQIEDRKIDFLVTNPGHYVVLQKKFRIAALATRERFFDNNQTGLLKFGAAIVTRADSKIRSLAQMKNRTFAAVSPDAFGGFQIAWYEFTSQNIDPYKDLKSIRFMGFPHDAIIQAIKSGDIDAGVVRAGLLESLASEGRISLNDFHVIETNTQYGYPHMVSSRLYPEWPFAVMPATDKILSEKLALALLNTQQKPIYEKFSLRDRWSVPSSYSDVRQLINQYESSKVAGVSFNGDKFKLPRWIAFVITGLMIAVAVIFYMLFRTRNRSRGNPGELAEHSEIIDPKAIENLHRFDSLTKREREVLCMICLGLSSKVIADKLGVSTKTVEFHRANLLQKTKAGTTPHLVQLATKLGFDQSQMAK